MRDEIKKLEGELGNEEAGAKRVNFYLETFFRCNFLSLKVIEKTSEDRATEGMPKGSHFEIIRNKKKENSNEEKANRNEEKANNLSEGEGNLIAFCSLLFSFFLLRIISK